MTTQTLHHSTTPRNVSPRSATTTRRSKRSKRGRRPPPRPLLDEKGKKDTLTRDDGGFRRKKFSGARRYRKAVASEWRRELELLDTAHLKRSLGKRLNEYMRCGHTVMVRQCGCGVERAGSGAFNRSCRTRSCPTCSWARSKEVACFFESAFETLGGPSDYAWRFIVLTIPYDPEDPQDLTAAALRSRAMLSARFARGLWKALLKRPGAAMYRSTEVGHRGHVHLNLIYFGPSISKAQVETAAAAVDCRAGWATVQDLDREPATPNQWARFRKGSKAKDSRGSKESLKRVARYVTKGMESNKGTFAEEWLGGDNMASTIDPRLAARWEVATYRLQLVGRYGALRGIQVEKHDHVALQEQDEDITCGDCGSVGDWSTVSRNAEDWIQRCHDVGWKALSRSVDPRAGPIDTRA